MEKRKICACTHKSDEERQTNILASWHASSVIAKTKVKAWHEICASLCFTSVPNQSILSFDLLLVIILSSYLFKLPCSQCVGIGLHQLPEISCEISFVCVLVKTICVAEPEATGVSLAQSPVIPSLIPLSPLLSPAVKCLQLPPTTPLSLLQAQTESLIPCWSTLLVTAWIFFSHLQSFFNLCIPFLPCGSLLLLPTIRWKNLSTHLLSVSLFSSPLAS